MNPKDVLDNWLAQNEQDCSWEEQYAAQKAYTEALEETVEALKTVIWEAYGEVTNGRYVDRWTRTAQILEGALAEYGEPDYDGDDPYGARNS